MRELILAVLKTGTGSFFILLLGTITTKIFAVSLGPSGVGLLSLLRQVRDSFLSLTTFNGSTALVQGLSSRKESDRKLFSLIVFFIMLINTTIIVLVFWIFTKQIAKYIFHLDPQESVGMLRWLILPIILDTGMVYVGGVLNGYRAIGRLAIVQVVSAAAALLLALPTVYMYRDGNTAAFVWMLALASAIGLVLALLFATREGWIDLTGRTTSLLHREKVALAAYHFISFAATTLVTGLASTWAILFVRSIIVSKQGLSAAGIFDVAWTLSMMYVSLVLSSFGTYYLPTLSQCADSQSANQLIQRVLRLTILLMVPIVTAVIVLKPLVVQLLYSNEFLPSLTVMRWMLLGDYLKSTSWVFGMTITAYAHKKALLWSELIWQTGFITLSALSINQFHSLEGVGIVFAFLYLAHLVFTFTYSSNRYKLTFQRKIVLYWILGLIILIGASLTTWFDVKINYLSIAIWGSISICFSWTFLTPDERKIGITKMEKILGFNTAKG